MKIVIIGGTGLVGSKLTNKLRQLGHEVTASAPSTGVNTITGEGLAEVLKGADTVVDLSNSPSFEDKAVLEFFETSGRNLLASEAYANVKHHIALSVVGADRLPDSGYLRAKVAQENLIRESGMPYTILRSTQFFEFAKAIAQSATVEQEVHLPHAFIQPIATDDIIPVLAEISTGTALNGVAEIGGPEKFRFDEWIGRFLALTEDPRKVIADIHSRYFGTELSDQELVAGPNAYAGKIKYDDWFFLQKLPA
jgi:uncharacterized protein YbjT (DUF2867 family)